MHFVLLPMDRGADPSTPLVAEARSVRLIIPQKTREISLKSLRAGDVLSADERVELQGRVLVRSWPEVTERLGWYT